MMPRIVLTLILAFVVTGCGGDSAQNGSAHQDTVVAAFYPLAYAARELGGDDVTVRNLTPPGVEPHDLELSGGEVREIRDAALVLYLGGGFQPALEDAIRSTDATSLDLLEVASPREGDEGGEGAFDPHVWLDPDRYRTIVEAIGRELEQPARTETLGERLRRLDEEYRTGLASCARRELVTSHDAFGYLAERYGLRQVPITGPTPEAEPTPRELERVVRDVRSSGATTIFFETLVSPRLAETVAREVGARTAVLNPLEGLSQAQLDLGDDYFTVMRENLAALRKALGCR
jgi:zinc transport system substrate-binding protein